MRETYDSFIEHQNAARFCNMTGSLKGDGIYKIVDGSSYLLLIHLSLLSR